MNTHTAKIDDVNNPDKVMVYARKKVGYTYRTIVGKKRDLIDKIKVLIPEASEGGGEYPNRVLGKPIVADSPSVCTMTYLVAGVFNDKQEANNYTHYLRTKFLRFLVSLKKNTQHTNRDRFSFVPDLPMDHKWTDGELYKRYDLSEEEISFIEKMIKEME